MSETEARAIAQEICNRTGTLIGRDCIDLIATALASKDAEVERLTRERDEARENHDWMRDDRNKWQDATTVARRQAEAAEGAAVKGLVDGSAIGDQLRAAVHGEIASLRRALSPAESEPSHCGGCGETDPGKRCIGCLADFGPTRPAEQAVTEAWPEKAKFRWGDRVTKIKGSKWTGHVCGIYSTALTPIGYAVESETETGSVQIYPEAALTAAMEAKR